MRIRYGILLMLGIVLAAGCASRQGVQDPCYSLRPEDIVDGRFLVKEGELIPVRVGVASVSSVSSARILEYERSVCPWKSTYAEEIIFYKDTASSSESERQANQEVWLRVSRTYDSDTYYGGIPGKFAVYYYDQQHRSWFFVENVGSEDEFLQLLYFKFGIRILSLAAE